jgi:hypothetical protein
MRGKVGTNSLILALALVAGAALAPAADEQSILQAVSRDTGVTVERLVEERAVTGFSNGDLRMGHLVAEALNRSFEDVTKQFKAGKPWHEIAHTGGLSLRDVERMAARRRHANPQP